MIISENVDADKQSFERLLRRSLFSLQNRANENPERISSLLGNKLEKEVVEVLNENALHTPFENSIELISGQRFPDIVAKRFYGIEVKTTKDNHWSSTGSSVAEGTRVNGVERIYMLFGKMCDPIEFRCRPYQECLSEVVVTHSPRYLIDMELEQGETFFDKIRMPYDEFRKQDDPIKTIVKYYKGKLKQGERLWWMGDDNGEQPANNLIIRIWNNLEKKERDQIIIKGYCLFPELFSESPDKFNRFSIWLSVGNAIVCPNVRDNFTAGGRETIVIDGETLDVPQKFHRLYNNLEAIKETILQLDSNLISEYWECQLPINNRIETWKRLVINKNPDIKLQKILAQMHSDYVSYPIHDEERKRISEAADSGKLYKTQ